jgi:glucose/mannose-6-phosphate isomerase
MRKATEIINEIKERESKSFKKESLKKEEIKNQPQRNITSEYSFHILNAIKLAGEFKVLEKVDRIVICGVGTNALSGYILESYLKEILKIKIEVIVNHILPEDVNSNTLVFIVSHTGDDEEPMLCYRASLRKGTRIIGIFSGGKLSESFKRNNVEQVIIPSNITENSSLPYLFFIMFKILENSRIIANQKNIIDDVVLSLKNPQYKIMAESIYSSCKDKIPLIYSSQKLKPVIMRWKNQFNNFARIHSFYNIIPNLCYNEINGFNSKKDNFHVIMLRDSDDDKYIIKSFSALKKIIKNKGYSVIEISIKGKNLLSRMFSSMYIGELCSYYFVKEKKIDLTKDNLIKKYKEEYQKTF